MQVQGLPGRQSEFKTSLGNLEEALSQSKMRIAWSSVVDTCWARERPWVPPQFYLRGAETGGWKMAQFIRSLL